MAAESLVNNFEIPSWAGKPPPGLHLDVMKETKMVQKLMIDEKKCYFFGRNKQLCDFCIDHASSSRVHAALIWHKHLNRPFIIDLGSTHGTFIGKLRLESRKPQQVPIDSQIHFGASTRIYTIRERPQNKLPSMDGKGDDVEGGVGGVELPENELELDNLTEFNTAHNRRITGIADMPDVPMSTAKAQRKRRNSSVRFSEEEDIINPEDIDPSVGRFRNMVQTTVIPKKKVRLDVGSLSTMTENINKRLHSFPYSGPGLYENIEHGGGVTAGTTAAASNSGMSVIALKLGLKAPNLAPEIEEEAEPTSLPSAAARAPRAGPGTAAEAEALPSEPKKKKYAKEAWPGKKPTGHAFLV